MCLYLLHEFHICFLYIFCLYFKYPYSLIRYQEYIHTASLLVQSHLNVLDCVVLHIETNLFGRKLNNGLLASKIVEIFFSVHCNEMQLFIWKVSWNYQNYGFTILIRYLWKSYDRPLSPLFLLICRCEVQVTLRLLMKSVRRSGIRFTYTYIIIIFMFIFFNFIFLFFFFLLGSVVVLLS